MSFYSSYMLYVLKSYQESHNSDNKSNYYDKHVLH